MVAARGCAGREGRRRTGREIEIRSSDLYHGSMIRAIGLEIDG
jgi:hypothetical protein